VGALAMLRINGIIDEASARASLPKSSLAQEHLERMWARMTAEPSAGAPARRAAPAAVFSR
ncbi:MAG: hypothetical protein ACRET5_07990, partial [Steroidobacteraceae bacterium]